MGFSTVELDNEHRERKAKGVTVDGRWTNYSIVYKHQRSFQ